MTTETVLDHMLMNWGRWASVRMREPRGSCYSLEGRYRAPQIWYPEPPRMPSMTAKDFEDAQLAERVILTMRKPEIGALCRKYAGMDAYTTYRVWALRAYNYDRVLPDAEYNVRERLHTAISAGMIMSEIASTICTLGFPEGGRAVPEDRA